MAPSDVTVRVDSRALPAVDSTVRIQLPTDELHVFDAATGDRLG